MNNSEVEMALATCEGELHSIETLINGLGPTTSIAPYLTRFAIILACGTIERSFKGLITDFCCKRSKSQVKQFIRKRIRDGSANPSWDTICKFLKEFDHAWHTGSKTLLEQKANHQALKSSLQSLVEARNDFAHGGSPSSSISDIRTYFRHSREIIEVIDTVIG